MHKTEQRVKLIRNGFIVSVTSDKVDKFTKEGFKKYGENRGRPKKA